MTPRTCPMHEHTCSLWPWLPIPSYNRSASISCDIVHLPLKMGSSTSYILACCSKHVGTIATMPRSYGSMCLHTHRHLYSHIHRISSQTQKFISHMYGMFHTRRPFQITHFNGSEGLSTAPSQIPIPGHRQSVVLHLAGCGA